MIKYVCEGYISKWIICICILYFIVLYILGGVLRPILEI